MIRNFLVICFILISLGINASEKMYVDENEFRSEVDAFYVHLGENVWISSSSVHRDEKGLYILEKNISRSVNKNAKYQYEKKWKCPYCYQYWPIGKKCQNEYCPSRYKD
jgi:hypothetical protein